MKNIIHANCGILVLGVLVSLVLLISVEVKAALVNQNIMMVSTTATPGGCGASTPDTQPFVKGDGTCTPSGFNTAVKATCSGSTPTVTLFTNDDGTCNSTTNSTFPVACQSVTGPGPFGESITMGFGMTCTEYQRQNLLQVTVYSGSCAVKSEPMVNFMVLNTCIMPPGLPIGGTIVRPPVSFKFQVFGTPNNVFLQVQSWTNGACQDSPSAQSTIKLDIVDGEAVIGCAEDNAHGFTGVGKDLSRRLSTVATEFKLHAVPENLPGSPGSAEYRNANLGTVSLILSVVTIVLWADAY